MNRNNKPNLSQPVGPVTREELEAVKRELDELRTEFTRLKSDTRQEIASGFEGVAHQLPAMIEGAVVKKFDIVNGKLDALILKAQAAETYRNLREEVEKDVAAQQGIVLDFALKKKQLEAAALANADYPTDTRHKRRLGVYTVLSGLVLGILGLIVSAVLSHGK